MSLQSIDWQRLGKSLFAAFVGSWLGCALFVTVSAFIGDVHISSLQDLWHGVLSFFRLLFSPIGLLAFLPMVVIGLPVQAVLQRAGKTGYVWNVVPAVIAGAILLPLILVGIGALSESSFTLETFGMGALAAFFVGSIAWLIRRPDKDAA